MYPKRKDDCITSLSCQKLYLIEKQIITRKERIAKYSGKRRCLTFEGPDFHFLLFFLPRSDSRLSIISVSHRVTNLHNTAERRGGRTLEIDEQQKTTLEEKKGGEKNEFSLVAVVEFYRVLGVKRSF